MNLSLYKMQFEGEVLERGYWLYVWKVNAPTQTLFYVGRTGDSSSVNAQSPFVRISQHLNFRQNAKGNSLSKHLSSIQINPRLCQFQMAAVGPIFPEEKTRDKHYEKRDILAALERELSDYLKKLGCNVLGTHKSRKSVDQSLVLSVQNLIHKELLA